MQVSDDNGMQCRLTFGNNILIARTRPSGTPRVDHIAYTVANWDSNKEQVEAELKRRGLKFISRDVKTSFHVAAPDEFVVQIAGLRQSIRFAAYSYGSAPTLLGFV